MKMIPATTSLETERLVLRTLKEDDAPQIFRLRSDATTNKYLDRPPATSMEDAIAFIRKIAGLTQENKTVYRAITLKRSDEPIGTITLWNFDAEQNKAEIGYELLQEFQGRGYMLEAVKAIIDLAFDKIGFGCVEGWTHPDNDASTKLLEKLGFTRDHEAEKTKPEDAKEIIYSLRKDH